MDEKHRKDDVKKGLDRLEDLEVAELSDEDLDSVAGGNTELDGDIDCNSNWCCSNTDG